jgi:DNA polymerase-4
VHVQFRNIFKDYSPAVSPKSIDEAVIDFTDTYALYNRSLTDIGQEIKRRFRREIGEWMKCSIGINTNRFLAKLAASLQKPDGLTTIDHTNVLSVYERVSLLDLNGINTRYQARLNAYGIHTPIEFFQASLDTLKKQVFQSIVGYYWFLRLRGYEIDQVDFARKSFGNTYALGKQTNDPRELARLLMKLCEKTGRRLRKAGYTAQGVHVACVYTDFSFWHTGRKVEIPLYTTREIYLKALRLLNQSGYSKQVRNLAISVYDLVPHQSEQLEMFSSKSHAVAGAMDKINDKYGEFVITPALMMGMDETIIDRISFGRVKESYQTIRNGLVLPLLRIKGCFSSLGRMSSRVPSRVRHQLQACEGGMRMTKGNLIMVITGVSTGALAGLLLAPKPGRETRQMLKSQAGVLRDQASQYATSLRDGQPDEAREQHGPEPTLEAKVRPSEGVEVENSAGSGEMEALVRPNRTSNQRRRRRRR